MANISGVLYEYLQSVQSYIAPPITAVFLLGIFSKRINATGALATLIMGLVVAIVRIGLELLARQGALGDSGVLYAFGTTNFLTFAAWFFLACVVFCVGVSLMSPAPSAEKIKGLTYGSLTPEQIQANRNSYNVWDIVLSLAVIGIVIYVMTSFTG